MGLANVSRKFKKNKLPVQPMPKRTQLQKDCPGCGFLLWAVAIISCVAMYMW